MLLPTHEPVLNPKFGVVISKTATCSLWTDKLTDRQTNQLAYSYILAYIITSGDNYNYFASKVVWFVYFFSTSSLR